MTTDFSMFYICLLLVQFLSHFCSDNVAVLVQQSTPQHIHVVLNTIT